MHATSLLTVGFCWYILSATGCQGASPCDPPPYVVSGPEVDAVGECPAFPESCPVDCDVPGLCEGSGIRCEDCADLQVWLDGNEPVCVKLFDRDGSGAFRLSCGFEYF